MRPGTTGATATCFCSDRVAPRASEMPSTEQRLPVYDRWKQKARLLAAQHRAMLCDDLQAWDGGGEVGGSRARGHVYTHGSFMLSHSRN